MIKPVKFRSVESKIIAIASLSKNRLSVITQNRRVHIISTLKKSIKKSFQFGTSKSKIKDVAITADGHFFAYANEHSISLIDLDIQELVHQISIDSAEPEILCFDAQSEYLIVGTTKGRVLLWQRESTQLLARLTSFPEHIRSMLTPLHNYVSALASYHHFVASSGYGDSVVISNLSTAVEPIRIYPGRSRINCIVFIDENKLLIGNEEGRIVKLFIHENRPHAQLSASIGAIKHLLILPDKTFALVASTHKEIALINIDTMEVIESHYITLKENIVDITLANDMLLYIALESGAIFCAKLMPVSLLKTRIENRQYELAYQLIEDVPILKMSAWYEDLEKIFSQNYASAIRSLLLGDEPGAHRYLEQYTRVSTKKKIVQELFYAFHHYERLQYLLKTSRFNVAYGLVEEFPPLRMTPEFQEIQKRWEDAFEQAQRLILQGKNQEAKDILQPFSTVNTKSPFIRLVLEASSDIALFSKAIATKDYKTLHVMTKRYPMLKQMPSHQKAMQESDIFIEEIMSAIKEDNFEDAQAECELLLDIPHLQKHYKHISLFIEKAQELKKAEESHNLRLSYEILDSFVALAILPRSKILESRWQQMTKRCENSALVGDAKDILKRIKDVMPLASRQERLGTLLRLAYRVQLKELAEKEKRFREGSKQYIKFFGSDKELRALLQERKVSLDTPIYERDHWLNFYRYLPELIYK